MARPEAGRCVSLCAEGVGFEPTVGREPIAVFKTGFSRSVWFRLSPLVPEDLAETVADIIAHGRGISVNALMLEPLQAEIESVKDDGDIMGTLRRLTEREKEILDRLAE